MNMKRMIALLVLAMLLALCMVLTACGSDPVEVGANPGEHEHADAPANDGSNNSGSTAGQSVCLHKETRIDGKKSATCQEQGYTGDKVCVACEKVLEAGSATPIGSCNYEDVEVLLEASCEMVGIKLCRCSVCGDEQNQSIKELGHQIERVDAVEDTVLNVSHDDFHTERCTREDCDYELEVKHSGRTYSYGATCEYPAYQEGTCSVCRVKYRIYDENSPATDHNWSEEGVVEGNETVYECLNDKCDAVKREPLDLPPSDEE